MLSEVELLAVVEGVVGNVELSVLLPTGAGSQRFEHFDLVLKNVLIRVVDDVAILDFYFCLGPALAMVDALLI